MTISIEIVEGKDAAAYIEIVSKLRIDTFAEYPYLSQGNLEYERKYMEGFTGDKRAMIAIARHGAQIAGISTGIPLASESDIVKEVHMVMKQEDISIDDYYYYGEVIVLPRYRGKGLVTMLFNAQDEKIKAWGFRHVCILTVIRPEDHPLKPHGYKNSDRTWKRLGFEQLNVTIDYSWPTFQNDGNVINMQNSMSFWKKVWD